MVMAALKELVGKFKDDGTPVDPPAADPPKDPPADPPKQDPPADPPKDPPKATVDPPKATVTPPNTTPPLTLDSVAGMTREQVNDNWDTIQKLLIDNRGV